MLGLVSLPSIGLIPSLVAYCCRTFAGLVAVMTSGAHETRLSGHFLYYIDVLFLCTLPSMISGLSYLKPIARVAVL